MSSKYHWSPKGIQKRDADRAEIKAAILTTLQVVVDQERAKDPSFNISVKFLEQTMKDHPEVFRGIRKYEALMRPYFSSDLDFLREKLGLPRKKQDLFILQPQT